MVGRRSTPLFVLICVLLMYPPVQQYAQAENITTAKLELFNTVQRDAEGNRLHSGAGSASIRIDQTGNRNVRSQFELSAALVPSTGGIDSLQTISRAYGKFRYQSYRGVIGKAPFSWGEGLIFNAADEIFGRGTGVNLMQQEFVDPTTWITSFSRYFGPFSFAELLVNPGPMQLDMAPANLPAENQDQSADKEAAGSAAGAVSPAGIEETRAGVRFVGKPGGLKLEGGYLFDGRDSAGAGGGTAEAGGTTGTGGAAGASLQAGNYFHRLYLNLQGNLRLDWYLSSSLELPDPDHIADSLPEALWTGQLYTAGVYSMIPAGYDDTLSFRVETRVYPAGTWSQDHSSDAPDYGIYAYSELSYDFGGGFSLIGRGLLSPIDLSARLTPGFSWNLFQGFTLLGFATLQTGEPEDTYAWEAKNTDGTADSSSSGLAVQVGCSITY